MKILSLTFLLVLGSGHELVFIYNLPNIAKVADAYYLIFDVIHSFYLFYFSKKKTEYMNIRKSIEHSVGSYLFRPPKHFVEYYVNSKYYVTYIIKFSPVHKFTFQTQTILYFQLA